MQEKKEYFEWVNIARGIGMILVVVGHACMCEGTLNEFLFRFIYSFHMPLFFFISGFCSNRIFALNSIKEKIAYCEKRAVRLMLPYTSVGIIYILLDQIMGITDLYENGVGGIFVHMLKGDNPNWQLWTLYTMFVCCLICAFLCTKRFVLPIIIAILLQIVYYTPLVNYGFCTITRTVEQYLFYFVAGLLYRKNEKTFHVITKMRKSLQVLAIMCAVAVNGYMINMYDNRATMILTAPLGIIAVIIIANLLQNSHSIIRNNINLVGKYGMDIYILANLCQDVIRLICWQWIRINEWFVLILSTACGIIIPIVISKYLIRRLKYCKLFILGIE